MSSRHPQLPRSAESLAAVAQCSERGLLVFDRSARVLAFNRSAATLLGRFAQMSLRPAQALFDDAYRLACADALQTSYVEQAVLDCARVSGFGDEGGAVPSSRTLRLGGPQDEGSLVMRLSSLGDLEPAGSASAACVVGVLGKLATRPTLDAGQLGLIFELSTASARVAHAYLHVDSVKDAARALGISVNTVKSHLAAIYERTGCSRQSQLVRLLMSLSSGEPSRRGLGERD
jgi:hypothetical protein